MYCFEKENKTSTLPFLLPLQVFFAKILSPDSERRLVSFLGEINVAFSYNEIFPCTCVNKLSPHNILLLSFAGLTTREKKDIGK